MFGISDWLAGWLLKKAWLLALLTLANAEFLTAF
jgi:hypothetical protein